ncbi:MAG TPA: hypothetical protein VJR23_03515 [Candidatus Acidoferrales bacterium]|nr:hypothetical protein [Candidatus Acidoferrales bacterium]
MQTRPVAALLAAIAVAIFVFFASPVAMESAGPRAVQESLDPAKIKPLDLKVGYWELNYHLSSIQKIPRMSAEDIKKMTANMSPEQAKKWVADMNAAYDKAEQAAAKGSDKIISSCPLDHSLETTPQISVGAADCAWTTKADGQSLHLHVLCRKGTDQEAEQWNDFERIDAEHFKGTIRIHNVAANPSLINTTITGKWMRESCKAPPAVAKNGEKPKGPEQVAAADPDRVVAVIDGKNVTAQEAWGLIGKVAPATRREYESRQPDLLEQIYMQRAVSLEAVAMHMDKQSPWKEKLANTRQRIYQVHQNYEGDPNIPPELEAQWQNARQHILWDAYFAQAKTKEERDALMMREREKFKITVKDPDFFNGPMVE